MAMLAGRERIASMAQHRSFPGESPMTTPSADVPEIEEVKTSRIACDGGGGALGHPRVWLQIGSEGWVECGYCDKRFVLKDGAGEH